MTCVLDNSDVASSVLPKVESDFLGLSLNDSAIAGKAARCAGVLIKLQVHCVFHPYQFQAS